MIGMKITFYIVLMLPTLFVQQCTGAKLQHRSLKAHQVTKREVYTRQSEAINIGVIIGEETWQDAEAYCEEQGGMLLKIPEEDLEFDVEEYLDEDHLEEEFWIGANDIEKETVVWADGSKVLWEPDEDAENDKDKNCVALCPEDDGSFSWKFRECSEPKNFLCQFPTEPDIANPGTDPCCEEPQPGSCQGAIPRYYYDCEKEECEMFWWSGCDEALNNFESKEECGWVCADTDEKPGQCPELEDFDNCEAECDWDEDCEDKMKCCFNGCAPVCTQPLAKGPCPDGSFPLNCSIDPCSVQKCETPPTDKEISCRPNHCGGCFAEFYDEADNVINCNDYCCLEVDPGNGEEKEARWYYNCEKKQCEEFIYFGADGNSNNFKSKEECHLECEIWREK
ncbi:tissue factor pathway inhibitor-like [Ptychodera flava]|uniref:tissue factor pathway inhibitor-like n=1 Tax=Ptychodera flava TaxID=63121 RepID=UPI00396A131B